MVWIIDIPSDDCAILNRDSSLVKINLCNRRERAIYLIRSYLEISQDHVTKGLNEPLSFMSPNKDIWLIMVLAYYRCIH